MTLTYKDDSYLKRIDYKQVKQSGLAIVENGDVFERAEHTNITFTAFGKVWNDRWYSVKALEIISRLSRPQLKKITEEHFGILAYWIRENYQHNHNIRYPRPDILKIGEFLILVIHNELFEFDRLRCEELQNDIRQKFV